ncbi:unnamed protein product [Danaus chrysippus]|uniref:(African queen) hypothetical protein n=1 Tax=Danaus chrysippus TaxID=151541 RepID=A0A8J2W2H6_9NEOP|nr:unnamed protein product [Danaus chrysippus]
MIEPVKGKSERAKRRMPMLSIDLPMSLLREKLNLEKERKVHAQLAAANRNFLNNIGKRGWRSSEEMRYPDLREGRSRPKRKMPSLSINNPMEVLRQRLLLEVARKQMREANQRQAVANRVFLQNVGKRGFWGDSGSFRYDN